MHIIKNTLSSVWLLLAVTTSSYIHAMDIVLSPKESARLIAFASRLRTAVQSDSVLQAKIREIVQRYRTAYANSNYRTTTVHDARQTHAHVMQQMHECIEQLGNMPTTDQTALLVQQLRALHPLYDRYVIHTIDTIERVAPIVCSENLDTVTLGTLHEASKAMNNTLHQLTQQYPPVMQKITAFQDSVSHEILVSSAHDIGVGLRYAITCALDIVATLKGHVTAQEMAVVDAQEKALLIFMDYAQAIQEIADNVDVVMSMGE